MKISLNTKFEAKVSYINSWNNFSKAILIKENFSKFSQILLVLDSRKTLEEYQKIFHFLWIEGRELLTNSDLCDLVLNKSGLFLTLKENLLNFEESGNQLIYKSISLEVSSSLNLEDFIKKLNNIWYVFSEFSINWSYKKYWDTITITDFSWTKQYKISFWWDNIDSLECNYLRNNIITETSSLEKLFIWWNSLIFSSENKHINQKSLINLLKKENIFTILDSIDFSFNYEDITEFLEYFSSFDFVWNKKLFIKDLEIDFPKIDDLDAFKALLLDDSIQKKQIFTKNETTIKKFLDYNDIPNVKVYETSNNLVKSFFMKKDFLVIWDDIISKIFIRKRIRKSFNADFDLLLKINIWDYVVHIDHWVWIFKWVTFKELGKIKKEYIEIEYALEDKLFVPIEEVWRVNKYIWVENPKLTWLNTKEWEKKLAKVREDVEWIAMELLEIYSKRKLWTSFCFKEFETEEAKFRNSFPYIYTIDQDNSIKEILCDMEKSEPMDRLLVWDVGFWKTEVAFNAIYRAFLNKKQSIFITPLVILAYEHFEKAKERFRSFWLKIEVLTRLESSAKVTKVIKSLKDWYTDLVIWTHKLLSDKIYYKDLWLLIVDEEHKFWVEDKEKIKKLKSSVDILSMSATPIPRSLNMALSNLRGVSMLRNAPNGRQPIDTTISRFSEQTIFDWCNKEFQRWGQVYFVHNRVQTLVHYEKILSSLFPDKSIVTTHWKLEWTDLEKRIIDFKNRKYDILLTTTVIENWIDFPNVNTIFINEAWSFWISQIHQLRWRVGRSDKKWHCYLLYNKENLSDETSKRLKTIVNYSYLWAWFELAMKDLEIRWWWDLLGIRQSGHATEIWINLYLKMVEEKISELKKSSNLEKWEENFTTIKTRIDLNINAWLKDELFEWELDKINFYREVETIQTIEELDEIEKNFKDINNSLDKEETNFFSLLRLKILSSKYNVESIKRVGINYQIDFFSSSSKEKNLETLKSFLDLDKDVKFRVIDMIKLRSETKNFANEEVFLNYMLNMFTKKFSKVKVVKIVKS